MPRPPRSNLKTRTHAVELRKEPTPAERKLWALIRNDQMGVNFRRHCPRRHQAAIRALGDTSRRARHWQLYPDFVCIEKKLIIELDGSQHLEQEEYDEERTKYLNSLGYKVIRFWNNDVMNNINGVISAIMDALGQDDANV